MLVVGAVLGLNSSAAHAADPFADHVVGYTSGSLFSPGYNFAATALGSPERFTGEGIFPSVVTPFNPAFLATEIVALGAGGVLTLGFDEPIRDDASNPFGLDLIVFGNTFFADGSYPQGVASGIFGPYADSVVSVSANGVDWIILSGSLNGYFPTLGYSDLTDPYAMERGLVPSDFTLPVDPSFNPTGVSFGQLMAGYAGSGGGTGFDISSTGLSQISFVRISVSSGELLIDGISDVSAVPGPGSGLCLIAAGLMNIRRRRVG